MQKPTGNDELVKAACELSEAVSKLHFSASVVCVYNPLAYAWPPHEEYLRRFGHAPKRVVLLGMNPGPFGMTQTGVPFGEVRAVHDWMGIRAAVRPPKQQHPKRPILGFDCPRSEVSGRRLWGLFAERFGTAEAFFTDHFVVNYCPLAFVEESGSNRTPDKLPAPESAALFHVCDEHLRRVLEILRPEWVIGVGGFAANRATLVNEPDASRYKVGQILHPSPASPAANRDWAGLATKQLIELGVWDRSNK